MNRDIQLFGFWVYLMTDLVIFSVLFSTYLTLRDNTFGGPTAQELFSMPTAFVETLILLSSSFSCSLATLAIDRQQKNSVLIWFLVTFLLGVAFLGLEISEFSRFVHEGASWQRSGFLSSFFTLVGTHGFHVSIGLMWILVLIVRISIQGITKISQMLRFALYWHFLDVIWIFIFTVVYGMGVLQ